MMRRSVLATAAVLAAFGAFAQGASGNTSPAASEEHYVSRVEARFAALAGSTENLQSLVHGLHTRAPVQLTQHMLGGIDHVTLTPATPPMTYPNITRALDLTARQLAAHGIENPTPHQLAAALNGGTIFDANGATVVLQGVLSLRSHGLGWDTIAQKIGARSG